MNVEATSNNAAQVAQSATVANTQAAQTAVNAQSVGGTAVLTGAGVTVTTAAPTTEEMVEARAASQAQTAFVQDAVTATLSMVEQFDALAGELRIFAEQLGETPTTESLPALDTQATIKACESFANGSTEAAEEEVTSSWVEDGKDVDANFSIYQLANLLQEIGQEQRNATRELRHAELETELASIDAEATKMRRGAVCSLAVGVTMAVIQTAVTVAPLIAAAASLGKSGKGTSSTQNVGQSATSLETLQAATESPEAASKNTMSISSQTSAENKTAVETRMKDCETAKAKYTEESAPINEAISETESFKAENEAKLADLNEQMNGDRAIDSETYGDLENQAATCKNNIEAADKTLEGLNSQLKTAQNEYCSALDKALGDVNTEYAAASEKTSVAETKYCGKQSRANGKAVKTTQTKQSNLGEQRSLVEAKVTEEKAKMGIKPSEADISKAETNLGKAQAESRRSPANKMMAQEEKKMVKVQAGLKVAEVWAGALGKSLSGLVDQFSSAAAKEEQGNQKQAEADRQETNDLFNQAQQLIDAARSLLQAVIQSESQSIEKIISA